MGAVEDLAAAILGPQAQQEIRAENPWYRGEETSDAITNLALSLTARGNKGRPYSVKEAIVPALVGGLASGLFKGFGDDYQNTLSDRYISAATALGNGENVSPESTKLPASLFGSANRAQSIFKLRNTLQDAEDSRKLEQQMKLAKYQQLAQAITQNPEMADEYIAAMDKLEGKVPQPKEPPKPELITEKEPDRFGIGETLQERKDKLILKAKRMGLTGNAADKYANEALLPDKLANASAEKTIKEARDRAILLSDIASTAKAGIAGAGNTGGWAWGAKDAASKLYATVSPEEAKQRKSQDLLDSVGPDIVKMSRSPGAVTEKEMDRYLGAGPNSQNTPATNEALADKIAQIASLEAERADFIESFVTKYGSARQAEKFWLKYKQANPLFVEDPQSGEYVLNTNRPPIEEFDFANAGTGASGSWNAPEGAQPTGRKTKDGKPTYIINGVEGVMD